MSHDAIVIGAGVNGLVAAHTLARAGRNVLVLERAETPVQRFDDGWLAPEVLAAVGVSASDATILPRAPTWLSAPLDGGGWLTLFHDVARSAEAIRRISPRDAAKWPEFCARMHALAGFLGSLYVAPPPDVESTEIGELLRLAATGLRARRLGRQGMIDLLRILPMSAWELLDDWFESDVLKGALGAGAVAHQFQGPRGGGTAFTLLHHAVGAGPGGFRPPHSNLSITLAPRPGITLRTAAHVTTVTVADGRATGVALASGEEIRAPLVLSSADPRATMLGMVDARWLDPEYARAARNVKCRGIVAKVSFGLEIESELPGPLTLAPSLPYVERAYDDAKHGRVSAALCLEAGYELGGVTAYAQYVPHSPTDGAWTAERRAALGVSVRAALAAHDPAFSDLDIVRVETPADFEAARGLTGGHLYHGEMTLDQILFMRPIPGWGRYKTPIQGLYLCGAGTHPGGGIAGASGRNAAREILRRERA